MLADLRRDLLPLLEKILASDQPYHADSIRKKYPLSRQRALMKRLASTLGFDFRRGRLDGSTQLFVSHVGPGDCRITTRYDKNQFTAGFFGVLHELGHALYEQGLDSAHYGTPMGEAPSLGMHESQARLWENNVGRSRPFWNYFFPISKQVFPEALEDVTVQMFVRAVNHVQPTIIRVYADQVTYDLHVMVRFELEKALIAGEMEVADIPSIWNRMYKEYLGIIPANDAEGCLQDSHWGAGMFGCFPSYTLGNIFAAQLSAAARKALPGLEQQFENGQFAELLSWLRQHVHRHGRRYSSADLISNATGSLPDHRIYVASLHERYREVYSL
jgi:carboxypeptidase Taq